MTGRRVALVTGAASGIGAAVCRRLAANGISVVVHTRRNMDDAARVAGDVRALGAEAEIASGDLADPEVAARLIDVALDRFGRLDILVSNAGFADRTPVRTLTDDAFGASHAAISGGFFRLARSAIPLLERGRDARIVAVSSFVSHVHRAGAPGFPASAVAKAGVEALVRALAIELAPSGITVNAVVPGYIRKDAGTHAALDPASFAAAVSQIPLGRLGLPDDVAACVAFLAGLDAGYITGQAIHVSGGLVI